VKSRRIGRNYKAPEKRPKSNSHPSASPLLAGYTTVQNPQNRLKLRDLYLRRNAFPIILLYMAETPTLDRHQNLYPGPVTKRCKWCKIEFTVTRIYPVQLYCHPRCRKAKWDHEHELRIADKIIKRRQRKAAARSRKK
jgi:hypothetical protein